MINFFTYTSPQGVETEMVEIVDENGFGTQMTKTHYETIQAEQSTPILPA